MPLSVNISSSLMARWQNTQNAFLVFSMHPPVLYDIGFVQTKEWMYIVVYTDGKFKQTGNLDI